MKTLNREEANELTQKVLSRDQEAFQVFYDQYNGVITHHVNMFIGSVQRSHGILYDYEDLCQELWWALLSKLPIYDHTKANMITFIYTVVSNYAKMIIRVGKTGARKANGESISIDMPISSGDDNSSASIVDFIIDPSESLEYRIIDEITIYEYIHLVSQFVRTLNELQKLVYLHSVKKLRQTESAVIIGITRSYVQRIRQQIYSKVSKFAYKQRKTKQQKAEVFSLLLLSKRSDDDISADLDYDLVTIKICREILREVGLTG